MSIRTHPGCVYFFSRTPSLSPLVNSTPAFFERPPDGFDGAGLQRFAGFEAHDRPGRDMGQLRQIAHTQFQSGSRHAALGSVH